jgi:hypothetical protein
MVSIPDPQSCALTPQALATGSHPLAGFFYASERPYLLIAPGVARVQELSDSHIILDPSITCVVVSRDAWRKQHIDEISRVLMEWYDRATECTVHGRWSSSEKDHPACIPDRLAAHFGPECRGVDLLCEPALAEMARDISAQIALLRELSLGREIFLNSRLMGSAPNIDRPDKHVDDQLLNLSCAYLGGGTVYQVGERVYQLQPGEIGLYKGGFRDESKRLVNEGQGLQHWTPIDACDYPRFVSLMDVHDATVPPRLEKFGSLVPWSCAAPDEKQG